MTSGAHPVDWDRMKDNKPPVKLRKDNMTTSSGSRPGKKLSVLKYRIIVNSEDFHKGLWREDAACVSAVKTHPEKYARFVWSASHTPYKPINQMVSGQVTPEDRSTRWSTR